MKTISITEAKRRLPELLQSAEPVTVTRHGDPIGTVKVRAVMRREVSAEQRAIAAARLIKRAEATASVADEDQGGVADLRRMRQRGDLG